MVNFDDLNMKDAHQFKMNEYQATSLISSLPGVDSIITDVKNEKKKKFKLYRMYSKKNLFFF